MFCYGLEPCLQDRCIQLDGPLPQADLDFLQECKILVIGTDLWPQPIAATLTRLVRNADVHIAADAVARYPAADPCLMQQVTLFRGTDLKDLVDRSARASLLVAG